MTTAETEAAATETDVTRAEVCVVACAEIFRDAGEIAALTRMVRPHVAVVTWVGGSHVEHFADGEVGIARAKAEIFEGVEPGGWAVWPYDNAHAAILKAAIEKAGLQSLSFGWSADADVHVLRADIGAAGTELVADVAGEEVHCRIGMAGRHWVSNALAVLVIAKWEHKFDRKKALAYEREVLGRFDKTADR